MLHCLKALADYSESGGHKNAASSEAVVAEWHGHDRVTLRFTSSEKREDFRRVARELLSGRWAEYSARDDDPPPPLGITFRSNGDSK